MKFGPGTLLIVGLALLPPPLPVPQALPEILKD